MKFFSLVLLFAMITVCSIGTAWGKCTQEEMEAKARIVAQKLEKLQYDNEMEYRFLLLRFNNKASLIDPNDIDALCELYDQIMLEL